MQAGIPALSPLQAPAAAPWRTPGASPFLCPLQPAHSSRKISREEALHPNPNPWRGRYQTLTPNHQPQPFSLEQEDLPGGGVNPHLHRRQRLGACSRVGGSRLDPAPACSCWPAQSAGRQARHRGARPAPRRPRHADSPSAFWPLHSEEKEDSTEPVEHICWKEAHSPIPGIAAAPGAGGLGCSQEDAPVSCQGRRLRRRSASRLCWRASSPMHSALSVPSGSGHLANFRPVSEQLAQSVMDMLVQMASTASLAG